MIAAPSPNFGPRPAGLPIDMLVLHYTGMDSGAAALERLRDPAAQVSAHYLIEEDGRVFALVAEEARAWHAGVAHWRGGNDVNSRSIGIELVNPGHDFGYRPFPAAQRAALTALARGLLARHPIPPRNVVGHADVAPRRKQDPGELFDWAGLAAAGVGLWPRADAAPPVADMAAALAAYGYDTADPVAAIAAFQRHFRPARVDGAADDECRALLAHLLRLAEEKN
ncbi:N-acetylmuramoyl-L-alanine amidase AmiD precursor [mine drainage metagenome]|uniref:N-acetylmuramoyl-L-alanine amidase n=1 Tax=mine drainage metagenome TaxID=410659 RepID=A0A1J5TD01_9ZZZZ